MRSIAEILPNDRPLMEVFNPEDWLKTGEVAQIFGVEPGTVGKWTRLGKFDNVRKIFTPTYQARFYRPDIEELHQQYENNATAKS